MSSFFSALEESLSPAGKHALAAWNSGFSSGDPEMTVGELRDMIARIFGERTFQELEAHLEARRRAVYSTAEPQTVPPGEEPYAHEWVITFKADSLEGARRVMADCDESWSRGCEPLGGTCPASMGPRRTYSVRKTKKPLR